MSTKNTNAFCLFCLLLIGTVLAQTNSVNLPSNSNNANTFSNFNTGMPVKEGKPKIEKLRSCRLINRADAEKMLGQKLETAYDEEDRHDEGNFFCFYTTAGAFARSVGYNYRNYSTPRIAGKAYKLELEIDEMSGIVYPANLPLKIQPIDGIGEAAVISFYKDSQSIFVKKGRANFTVSVDRNDAASLQALKKAAKKVATHF